MDEELIEEIDFEMQLLIKSGFYNDEEILEIIEDEFFEENVSSDIISSRLSKNYECIDGLTTVDCIDFNKLENTFNQLSGLNDIVTIHNAGYDLEEGIQDAFELFVHLRNNQENPQGFCLYSLEDVEMAIEEKYLSIAFGDFDLDEKKAIKIGETVVNALKDNGFDINWDGTVDNPIKINPFNWKKVFSDKEFSIEGALEVYNNFH